MSSEPRTLEVPPELRRGGRKDDEPRYLERGRNLLAYMSEILGLPDLSACRVLDVGCGTKFTEAILKYDIPIGGYVGIDVYKPMIDFLQQNVRDPRFSFHHMNTQNDMYNPQGEVLSANTRLPGAVQEFDIICLFSVFTHLAPRDYRNMLHALQPCIKASGHLVFSLFIDEVSGTGHGLIERIAADMPGPSQPSGEPFRDAYPGKPLQWALYSREHAFELIAGTGWQVEDLLLPKEYVQHHFICTPVYPASQLLINSG